MTHFTPLRPGPDRLDEFLSDRDLGLIRGALIRRGLWQDGFLIGSYVQEAKIAMDNSGRKSILTDRVVFVLMSDHPTIPGQEIMTYGNTRLDDYRKASKEYAHSTSPTLAIQFFEGMAREHLRRINDLKGLTVAPALGAD